jgi:hypothetical protein
MAATRSVIPKDGADAEVCDEPTFFPELEHLSQRPMDIKAG